jgi:copper transport protein
VTVRRGGQLALAGGAVVLLLGSAPAWPGGAAVHGHSQLVSSSPGSGEVVPTAPTELRLIFSEPLETRYTGLDLLDADGRALLVDGGQRAADDPYALVTTLEGLADGTYTVNWRALSAADGHVTQGFITFGVGQGSSGGTGGIDADPGAVHGGHTGTTALIETAARALGYLGPMLAFGLTLVGRTALRGTGTPASVSLARVAGIGLLLSAAGAGALIELAASSTGIDPLTYATDSRSGTLLTVRLGLGLVGGLALLVLAWTRRPRAAPAASFGFGAAGILAIAMGGHAAAFTSLAPVVTVLVHVAAAAVWLSGLVVVAWIAARAGLRNAMPLDVIVPRFSALALVSLGLVALTGTYSAIVQTTDPLRLDTPYGTAVAVKVGVFLAAIALGGLNYLDGGRDTGRLGSLRGRLLVETALACGVVAATGNLASGSPPAQVRPIPIAPAASAIGVSPGYALGIQPGRPGGNRFVVTEVAAPPHGTVELIVQRLDVDTGVSRVGLRPVSTAGSTAYVAEGGRLPASSSWDVTVAVSDHEGREVTRQRFTFALDAVRISSGRATPPIDPQVALALMLIVVAIVSATYALAGGTLARCDARASRQALLVGSICAGSVGIVIVTGGP